MYKQNVDYVWSKVKSVPVRVAKPGTTGPCDFYQYLCTGHALDKADTFTVPEQTKKRITI